MRKADKIMKEKYSIKNNLINKQKLNLKLEELKLINYKEMLGSWKNGM